MRNIDNDDLSASEMLISNSYLIQNKTKNCFQKPNCVFIFSMETEVAGSGGALGMFSRGVFNVAVFVANLSVFLVFLIFSLETEVAGSGGALGCSGEVYLTWTHFKVE